jgi:TonB family protein
MEKVGPSPPDDEIHLLTEWGDPSDRPRGRRAAAFSLLIHMALVLAVVVAPAALWETPQIAERLVTPLIAPLTALTQTDPNKGKLNKEFDVVASEARKRIQISPGADQPKPFNPPPPPPAPAPKPLVVPEPPKIEDKAVKPDLPQIAQTLPPRIEPVERPKLVLESPVTPSEIQPGQGRPLPKATAEDAIRGVLGGGASGRPGGPGSDLPSSSGLQPNNMQLLSDPMGVDFKPYLAQVLASVKRYWMAIWPEAARQGRSGKVVIQFSIDHFGTVPKLVIASGSGANALDFAAVAAIQSSVPFPILPRDYKGDLIKLQLNFAYNMPN